MKPAASRNRRSRVSNRRGRRGYLQQPLLSTLACIPFRVVYVPTALAGRAAVWLAHGYRTASALERLLILPSWALCRGLFLVGSRLAHLLHRATA
jgi:hypothetical protein